MKVTEKFSDTSTFSSQMEIASIPQSFIDLIDGPYWAALTTMMPNGQPQTTPVWCNREGDYIMINTMRDFRKEKNMRVNPHVNLLIYDPANPARNIEVRGLVIEMSEKGAMEHNDRLTQLYLGKPGARFFGEAVPAELAKTYVPVKITIAPIRVRAGDPTPSSALKANSGQTTSGHANEEEDLSNQISISLPTPAPVPVPASHQDLLARPVLGILATMMADGQPQASLVWVDYDGTYVLINTEMGRQKCKNMQANPRATLLVVDPNMSSRWIELRCLLAGITTDGAVPHADKLAQRYLGKQHFYGEVYKVEWKQYERRVIVKLAPVKMTLDAIFK